MNKIFYLKNPDGRIVKSAWISETAIGVTVNVESVLNGSDIYSCRTLRGAKQIFGTDYMKGGIWEQRT